jgi:type I site-specific restriction endonuclease
MKLNKENVLALKLAPEVEADILALLEGVTTKETELENLRKKVPTDSQKVVEGVDFDKFKAATTELEKLKKELAEKLENQPGQEEGETLLSAFASFFS